MDSSIYPATVAGRDLWVRAQRAAVPRAALNARQPYAFLVEDERAADGEIVPVATVFLTNRGCPWSCVMCDLWRNTLAQSVEIGDIPAQIDYALERLPAARQIKLYNSGSFFDRRAIPREDYAAIAARASNFERAIVESHPLLVGDDCLRLRDLLNGQLEVAIGLETVHPTIGPRINKRATLQQFAQSAQFLRENGIALRTFILVKTPWMNEAQALEWACKSLDFAFECGASVAAVIPTRAGNGAMEALRENGEWSPPRLQTLEAAAAYGIGRGRGRVFADLWDLEQFSNCPICFAARRARLEAMNATQTVTAPVECDCALL